MLLLALCQHCPEGCYRRDKPIGFGCLTGKGSKRVCHRRFCLCGCGLGLLFLLLLIRILDIMRDSYLFYYSINQHTKNCPYTQ